MLWNIFMHVLIGLLGTQFFDWTARGILSCIGIVALTQASELLRYYMDGKRLIEKGPASRRDADMAAFRKELPHKLPSMYAQNMLMFSAIVLFSAEIGRSSGYGL